MEGREIIYKMAYSFLKKRITADNLRDIEEKGITAEAFFTLPTKELIAKSGIRKDPGFDKIAREEAVALARKEWENIKNHNITPLFVLDDNYPPALAETSDPPLVLYKIGEGDLEGEHFVSVVGTRKPTAYGLDFCNKIVTELGEYFPDVTIVSGLAYGIDACAHTKALEMGIKTIAVVAHGLNMIYPAANRKLAKDIIYSGGAIISEYPFGVNPFKPHFLARNRIVAGLSSATIVVESNIKGGAMSTANYAFLYNREVMALPGRSTDEQSSGCNLLIRKNKAHLIECAADLIETTGWRPINIAVDCRQRNLFPELEGEGKKLYEILQYHSDPMQVDQLVHLTGFSTSKVLASLGELEFDGIIMRLPGNRFTIA